MIWDDNTEAFVSTLSGADENDTFEGCGYKIRDCPYILMLVTDLNYEHPPDHCILWLYVKQNNIHYKKSKDQGARRTEKRLLFPFPENADDPLLGKTKRF